MLLRRSEYDRLKKIETEFKGISAKLDQLSQKTEKKERVFTTLKWFNRNDIRFKGEIALIGESDEMKFLMEEYKLDLMNKIAAAKTPDEQVALSNQYKGIVGFIDRFVEIVIESNALKMEKSNETTV